MYEPDEINELRRLHQLGQISTAELEHARNALRDLVMPQPRYDMEPMQENTMRIENGPEAGKVIPMNFPTSTAPQEKLGDAIEYMGKRGRYSEDGRNIVFADGTRQDLFPERTKKLEAEKYTRDKRAADLKIADITARRGEMDLEQDKAKLAALQNAPKIQPDDPTVLNKRFGAPEKGKRWVVENGQPKLVPIAGSEIEDQTQEFVTGASETVRKIDEMIGQRDEQGRLVQGAKPHAGFEDYVGATYKPFARLFDGTDAADFERRLDEVKGGAFLKAFESLKGGGQITEVEGKKATDAITRMAKSQSEDEFVKAATEFRNVVALGLQRAQGKIGQAPQSGGVKKITSEAEWAALAPGTQYIGPDGKTRTKK